MESCLLTYCWRHVSDIYSWLTNIMVKYLAAKRLRRKKWERQTPKKKPSFVGFILGTWLFVWKCYFEIDNHLLKSFHLIRLSIPNNLWIGRGQNLFWGYMLQLIFMNRESVISHKNLLSLLLGQWCYILSFSSTLKALLCFLSLCTE